MWNQKKQTSEEIKELVELIFKEQKQLEISNEAIDMCGTGGDKLNTFNISTLAAILTSSCGLKVIKHSGRSTTSITGSVDILSQFGLNVDINVKEKCFKETNLMFVSSKVLRETFGKVKEVCKKINSPSFVNLLGPLTNPYKTKYHLLGVSKIEWGELLVSTLKLLDKKNEKEAMVVCSEVNEKNYLDELSFCGKNHVWHLKDGEVKEYEIWPKYFGVDLTKIESLAIKNVSENKIIFEDILKGNTHIEDPRSQIVALNVGAVLYLAKKVKSIASGYNLALEHIQTGKAWEHFQNFMNCNKLN